MTRFLHDKNAAPLLKGSINGTEYGTVVSIHAHAYQHATCACILDPHVHARWIQKCGCMHGGKGPHVQSALYVYPFTA